mgnify:CR=1 FL=1
MSRPQPPSPPGAEIHHPVLHLSPLRLFAVVVVFLVLASYAVWNSERFQNLFQGVSQTRISAALGRPVTFRQVEIRFLPPSVQLADVRIALDFVGDMRGTGATEEESALLRQAVDACCEDPDFDVLVPASPDRGA